ncbi:hypothetical protein [uncultured Sphaerotilus sp.]|uniref:hypothetical protein n=1 Tax=uncultured Sphaerotilus sp. TaxID=474984 RepID=UPI0030CA5635
MSSIINDIKDHLPLYLTMSAKDGMLKALKDDFPNKINYYTDQRKDDFLQGDGWGNLDVLRISDSNNLERKSTKGIILSNSCDISTENKRQIPPKYVFAPIIKLSRYKAQLQKDNAEFNSIEAKIESIKKQQVTSIFYLPEGGPLEEDYIAILDDLHSVTLNSDGMSGKTKFFTLSQIGFFMFLFKLSIHFCRFHENVFRDGIVTETQIQT